MNFLRDDIPIGFQCIGALGALAVALALRMSFFRLAGSPGEGKINSPLERMYEAQQLTAEWAPLGCVLILANMLKGSKELELYVNYCALIFTVCRYVFVARYFLPFNKGLYMMCGMPTMIGCYTATAGLAAMLLCPI